MATFDTNVDYTESRAVQINVVTWVLTGLATIAVGLKLFNRLDKKLAGWDDLFISLSMVTSHLFMFISALSDKGHSDNKPDWLHNGVVLGIIRARETCCSCCS